MTGGTTRSDYPSGPLDDTPNSSAHRGDTATRDTTLHTHTTATLPPEELNDIQMSFTEIVPVVPEEKQSKQSQPNDTMDSADFSTLRTVAPPPQNCSVKETMEFVKYQLNRIGMETEILDGLLLLGAGRTERLEGGQAIVQMARSKFNSHMEYAIKFFMTRKVFEAEAALYQDKNNSLGKFLPELRAIVDNKDGRVVDPAGHPLPPCIIMERGESLDIWSQRAKPDRMQSFSMLEHLAERLQRLHASGYVHRDLKPANVMWLPRENRWTIIDFGCAARIGTTANLMFSLLYAAPEVVNSYRTTRAPIQVTEALDAWSLGIMAFELLTGKHAIKQRNNGPLVMDQIMGSNGMKLPWEVESETAFVRDKLGIFVNPILQLLHRDPSMRATMDTFLSDCRRVMSASSILRAPVEVPGSPQQPAPQEQEMDSLPCGCIMKAEVVAALRVVGQCSNCHRTFSTPGFPPPLDIGFPPFTVSAAPSPVAAAASPSAQAAEQHAQLAQQRNSLRGSLRAGAADAAAAATAAADAAAAASPAQSNGGGLRIAIAPPEAAQPSSSTPDSPPQRTVAAQYMPPPELEHLDTFPPSSRPSPSRARGLRHRQDSSSSRSHSSQECNGGQNPLKPRPDSNQSASSQHSLNFNPPESLNLNALELNAPSSPPSAKHQSKAQNSSEFYFAPVRMHDSHASAQPRNFQKSRPATSPNAQDRHMHEPHAHAPRTSHDISRSSAPVAHVATVPQMKSRFCSSLPTDVRHNPPPNPPAVGSSSPPDPHSPPHQPPPQTPQSQPRYQKPPPGYPSIRPVPEGAEGGLPTIAPNIAPNIHISQVSSHPGPRNFAEAYGVTARDILSTPSTESRSSFDNLNRNPVHDLHAYDSERNVHEPAELDSNPHRSLGLDCSQHESGASKSSFPSFGNWAEVENAEGGPEPLMPSAPADLLFSESSYQERSMPEETFFKSGSSYPSGSQIFPAHPINISRGMSTKSSFSAAQGGCASFEVGREGLIGKNGAEMTRNSGDAVRYLPSQHAGLLPPPAAAAAAAVVAAAGAYGASAHSAGAAAPNAAAPAAAAAATGYSADAAAAAPQPWPKLLQRHALQHDSFRSEGYTSASPHSFSAHSPNGSSPVQGRYGSSIGVHSPHALHGAASSSQGLSDLRNSFAMSDSSQERSWRTVQVGSDIEGGGLAALGSGTRLTTGKLQLAGNACLILDSSCAGWVFSRMTFKDGTVVCFGQGCNVTFQTSAFKRCTLVAMEGARVAVADCVFSNDTSKCDGLGVIASGAGTTVVMQGGSITGGTQGVSVQSGATLDAQGLTTSGVSVTGIEVRDKGSSLHLEKCKLEEFSTRPVDTVQVSAVLVQARGAAQILSTNVHGANFGIQVCSSATANIFRCQIEEARHSCCAVRGGATAILNDCKLAQSQKLHGLQVEGGFGHVEVSNCRFLQNAQSGVYACDGATIVAEGCKTEGNKFSAFTSTTKADMTITSCECLRDARGVVASVGGRLTVRNGVISNCDEEGCAVWDKGVAMLQDCQITSCGAQGVRANKMGAKIEMEGCLIRDTQKGCIWLDDSYGKLVRCTVDGSRNKHGIAVEGEYAVLDAEECLVQKHAQNGVFACDTATVRLKACRSEHNGIHCFMAETNAKVTLGSKWDKECTWDLTVGGCVGCSGGEVVVERPRPLREHERHPLV